MAIFAVKVEDNVVSRKFMHDTHKRLTADGYTSFLVSGQVIQLEQDTYLIEYNIKFFKIYWVGIIWVITAFVLSGYGWTWWQVPGILFLLSYLLWDIKGLYGMVYLGLKKVNYTGDMQLVSNEVLLKLLLKRIANPYTMETTKLPL